MPDYDPTSIPILDDVIENKATGSAVSKNIEAESRQAEDEANIIESALLDYNKDDKKPVIDVKPGEPDPQITEQLISLESIADDIVKQLMPNLEQHLRHLVKQALEKKLPDEIIKSVTTKLDD